MYHISLLGLLFLRGWSPASPSPAVEPAAPWLERLHGRLSWLVSVLLSTMVIFFLKEYEWIKAKGHRPASSYRIERCCWGCTGCRPAGWKDTSCPRTNVGQLTKRLQCSQCLPAVDCQDLSSAQHSSTLTFKWHHLFAMYLDCVQITFLFKIVNDWEIIYSFFVNSPLHNFLLFQPFSARLLDSFSVMFFT